MYSNKSARKSYLKWSSRRRSRIFRRLKASLRRRFATALIAVAVPFGIQVPLLAQLPTGGEIVAGAAAISNGGSAMNITSQTDRAIINWQNFSVGQGSSVNFAMPNSTSAVLNRVVTEGTPSIIAGAINSNGNVYLSNPSGIVVGPTGAINTNGFRFGKVLNYRDVDFLPGGSKYLDLPGMLATAPPKPLWITGESTLPSAYGFP